ncbi:MAG: HAMP domain-containing sensor histidine kinase [Thermoleophilia bacterium]
MLGLLATALVFALVSSGLVRSESSRNSRREFDRTAMRIAALVGHRVEQAATSGHCSSFQKEDLEAFLGTGAKLWVVGPPFCPGAVEQYGNLPVAQRVPIDRAAEERDGFVRLDGRFTAGGPGTVATAVPVRVKDIPVEQIIVTKPSSQVRAAWTDVAPTLMWAALIGFVPAMLLALLLTGRVTRPLQEMERAAEQVAGGELTVTVPRAGTAELDHLGSAFNEMVVRLRERDDDSREFLMKVTHDLRTPLTAIRGHAAALADGVVPQDQVPRSLAAIEGEAGRLEAMVTDLLDLARIDARRFRVDPTEVDPVPVLAQAFDAFMADAARREVRFERRMGPLPFLVTDAARLRQIVANLLDNALRWSPKAGAVTMVAQPQPAGGLRVEVTDSGPGVMVELREAVFQPFRSAETPDGRTGTGLGLAICRQLARELGGDVVVDDAPAGGARFTLTLPSLPVSRVAGVPAGTPNS